MKNTQKTLNIATLLTGTLAVYAQGGMSFADFDANKNDLVSEQEFNAAKANRIAGKAKEGRQMKGLANLATFAEIDSNADGKVSPAEFAGFLQEHEKKGH
ncbi:MAG: hypothetical protein L3J51_13475 [Cocleimonas sp.]|nr:hypothetical protein [Cocleimonas sp.]